MAMFGYIYAGIRQRTIGVIDTLIWLFLVLHGFFLFRRTASQMAGAIDSNRALFSYRQVKPTDTVLMRGVLEGLLMAMVITIVGAGMALLGHNVTPADPMRVLAAFFGLWFLGVSLGLLISVLSELAQEFRQIINMAMMPLYFISGVMFPLASIPEPYREWLLLNPIAHGLEEARSGFAPYYHAAPGVSISYIYEFAFISIFIGLLLHRRFALRMVTR